MLKVVHTKTALRQESGDLNPLQKAKRHRFISTTTKGTFGSSQVSADPSAEIPPPSSTEGTAAPRPAPPAIPAPAGSCSPGTTRPGVPRREPSRVERRGMALRGCLRAGRGALRAARPPGPPARRGCAGGRVSGGGPGRRLVLGRAPRAAVRGGGRGEQMAARR